MATLKVSDATRDLINACKGSDSVDVFLSSLLSGVRKEVVTSDNAEVLELLRSIRSDIRGVGVSRKSSVPVGRVFESFELEWDRWLELYLSGVMGMREDVKLAKRRDLEAAKEFFRGWYEGDLAGGD